MVGDTIIMSSI